MNYFQLLTTLSLLLISAFVLAENKTANIDQTVARFQSFVVVTGQFTQEKKLAGVNQLLRSSGTFVFWREQGLLLSTEKPFQNAITISRENLIHWDKNGKGKIVKDNSSLVQREINKTLLAFFGADIELIQDRFDLEWRFEDDNRWQVVLTPKLESIKKYMSLVVIEGEYYLKKISVSFSEEDKTVIEFSNQAVTNKIDLQSCRWFYLPVDNHCQ
jgi:outer membrane lipoprotein-sorting protein